jgi:hypothetical protein
VREAIAEYWLSYRISYQTGERIYVSPGVGAIRLPRDQEMVREGGPWNTLIFFTDGEAERASSAVAGRDPIIVPVRAPTDPYHWEYAAVSIYLPTSPESQTPPEAQASAGQPASAGLASQ